MLNPTRARNQTRQEAWRAPPSKIVATAIVTGETNRTDGKNEASSSLPPRVRAFELPLTEVEVAKRSQLTHDRFPQV
jgi:hypothetical protein